MHQLCVRSVTARRSNRVNEKMLNYHTFRFVIQYSSILRSITRLSIQLISINRLISWIRSSRFLLLFISFSAAHRIFTHRKLWLTWEHSVCFLTSHSPNSQLVQVVLYFHVFFPFVIFSLCRRICWFMVIQCMILSINKITGQYKPNSVVVYRSRQPAQDLIITIRL